MPKFKYISIICQFLGLAYCCVLGCTLYSKSDKVLSCMLVRVVTYMLVHITKIFP